MSTQLSERDLYSGCDLSTVLPFGLYSSFYEPFPTGDDDLRVIKASYFWLDLYQVDERKTPMGVP